MIPASIRPIRCAGCSTSTGRRRVPTSGCGPGCGTASSRAADPGMALLDISAVSKRFAATVAVDGVSLSIERGEFFALLGPSGCGKTTLLRLIAGFETPDEGRILIDGIAMNAVPPYQRPVNMMFQSYA